MIRADRLDTVTVSYTGTLEDGTVFDQSPSDRPLRFIIGKEEVIAGFEAAVLGMYQGETKTVVVPCQDGYGEHLPERVETIERSLLPPGVALQPGKQLEVTRQDRSIFHVMVLDVDKQTVTLDANHPLAGKTLTFKIELLQVVKPSPTERTQH